MERPPTQWGPSQYLTFSKLSLTLDNLVVASPLAAFLNKVEFCTFPSGKRAESQSIAVQ